MSKPSSMQPLRLFSSLPNKRGRRRERHKRAAPSCDRETTDESSILVCHKNSVWSLTDCHHNPAPPSDTFGISITLLREFIWHCFILQSPSESLMIAWLCSLFVLFVACIESPYIVFWIWHCVCVCVLEYYSLFLLLNLLLLCLACFFVGNEVYHHLNVKWRNLSGL